MEEITKFATATSQEQTPAIGMIKNEAAQEPMAPVSENPESDDPQSRKEITEMLIYKELQARAQHLMDYVNEKRLTRAQLLAALLDR